MCTALQGRDVNVTAAVRKETITRGLKYSLATGNWGMQGTQGLRAGVSQVQALDSAVLCRTARMQGQWDAPSAS